MEQQETTLLAGATDLEKGAYLGVIASLATADRVASEEEQEYLRALCASAELSEAQTHQVLAAAQENSDAPLTRNLETLQNSDLRYSLVTDLISFAKADQDYSATEQQYIQHIAQKLQVDPTQFSLLDQYTDEAAELEDPQQAAAPNFLANSGMQQKMQAAGINTGGLLKGLLSFAGPMILASMLRRRGGGLGGMMGGMMGGMLGGGMGRGGGLGSLMGMLSGGRGMRGAGGMLGRMFGGRL